MLLPLRLNSNNLGKRQKELNIKVNEAAQKKQCFDSTNDVAEESDVDRLFKIDLASKYKNIDYILETLKCGDSLYISRAIKCQWIYSEEYFNIINPNTLNDEIFPFMSERMKKKLLTAISCHSNETRAQAFYTYLMKTKQRNLALKFLVFTNEDFKLEIISNNRSVLKDDAIFLKNFLGSSFLLADAYLSKSGKKNEVLFDIRYLFSVSNEKYLDFLEKFYKPVDDYCYGNKQLGLRLTKDIVKGNKKRIFAKPDLYMTLLCIKVMFKDVSIEELKIFAKTLLPKDSERFWVLTSPYTGDHRLNRLLEFVPKAHKHDFIKSLFEKQYPNEEFEMHKSFFYNKLFENMTSEQKERWALKHLENNDEYLGEDSSYAWYAFINFNTAFAEIKAKVHKTANHERRAKMLETLVSSASNQKELEILLDHYYNRHVNEQRKDKFVEKVIDLWNVLELNETCWASFNKLLYSLQVYNPSSSHYVLNQLKCTALLYYVIHDLPIPEILLKFAETGDFYYAHIVSVKIKKENYDSIWEKIMKVISGRLTIYKHQDYTDDIKLKLRPMINNTFNAMNFFKKKLPQIPDIVVEFAKLDKDQFAYILTDKNDNPSQGKMMRLLKKDVSELNEQLPILQEHYRKGDDLKLNKLFRKLDVYFSEDTSKVWLEQMRNWLTDLDKCSRTEIYMAVFAVFLLGKENDKTEFVKKYAPAEAKINYVSVNYNNLFLQEAICRFLAFSRPLMPMSLIRLFMKGDYARQFTDLFSIYAVNVPKNELTKFVEPLLDSPVAIQKQAIKLAFKCLALEDIKKLNADAWSKTKNVSLRKVLFLSLYNVLCNEDDITKQRKLLDVIKSLMAYLNKDDDSDIFKALRGTNLKDNIKSEFLEYAWEIIDKMPKTSTFLDYRQEIIREINKNMNVIKHSFVKEIIVQHVNAMFDQKKMFAKGIKNPKKYLNSAKWELVVKFIFMSTSEDAVEPKLSLLDSIITKTFNAWDVILEETYVTRLFFNNFVNNITIYSNEVIFSDKKYKTITKLIELTLQRLESKFEVFQIYLVVWKLKLLLIKEKVMKDRNHEDSSQNKVICVNYGNEIGKLLEDFVNSGMYFPTLLVDIVKIVQESSVDVLHMRNGDYTAPQMYSYICLGLVNVKIVPTHLLALHLLPTDIEEVYEKDFKVVLSKIKKINDSELKCSMYQKYCTDGKRKKYI